MVSAPQFSPAIPELSRVLIQREEGWGVDPYLNFFGQWRVKVNAATSTVNPDEGEIVIAINRTTGVGAIRIRHENAAEEDVTAALRGIAAADKLMLGGSVSLNVGSVVVTNPNHVVVNTVAATGTTSAFVQNDFDSETGGQTELEAILINSRLAVGVSNTAKRNRVIFPLEPIEIMEDITSYTDEMTRGRFAMDYDQYSGMRMVTGRIASNVYLGSDPSESVIGAPTGHFLRAFWGNDKAVEIGNTGWHVHNFFGTDVPGSMVVEVQDNVNQQTGKAAANREPLTPVSVGVMVERMTLNFDANDGMLRIGGDLRGRRAFYIDPPDVTVVAGGTITALATTAGGTSFVAADEGNITIASPTGGGTAAVVNVAVAGGAATVTLVSGGTGFTAANAKSAIETAVNALSGSGATVTATVPTTVSSSTSRYPELDKSSIASVGWHGSVIIAKQGTNPLPTVGKVLSAEITLEREISVHGTEGDNQIGTIRAARPIRCTYRMTFEFVDYTDFQKYSKDNPANDQYTDYTNNRDRVVFRFSNQPKVTTDLPDVGGANILALTGDHGILNDDSHGVLDIVLHRATIGESPASINRGEFSNTMEVNGRAFLDETPDWFGADPGEGTGLINNPNLTATDVRNGSKIVQMRLINRKSSIY